MLLTDSSGIVLLPPNWLGDVVMAQPAMRAVAEALPQSRITLCGRPWLADMLPFLGLGEHAVYEPHFPAHSDAAILFRNSLHAAWDAFRAGAALRIGFRGQWRSLLLKPALTPQLDMKNEHHREYFLNLVTQIGIPVFNREVSLQTPDAEVKAGCTLMQQHGLNPERTLCVAPGAQFGGAKRYPAQNYRHALGRLAADGWQILALGTAAERDIAGLCLADVQTAHWNASGRTSLRQALQIVAASRLLLCNDSGMMHVAAGMGRPVVAIFGATAPARTAPSGDHVTLLYEPAACSPCLQRECSVPGQPCMASILPEMVYNACCKAAGAIHTDESTGR